MANPAETIFDQTEYAIGDLVDDVIWFGLDDSDAEVSGRVSLATLKKAMTQVEANVAGVGTPNALTANESFKVLTNEGVTAKNYHTLPAAAASLTYTFVVQDADGLRITAGADDTIRLGSKVTAAAGYIESTTIGDYVTLVSINAVEWVGHAYGTWTDGTFTYTLATTT